MTTSDENHWMLEDDDGNPYPLGEPGTCHARFTLKACKDSSDDNGPSVEARFRLHPLVARRVSKIVQSKLDPRLETVSDIYHHATVQFVRQWDAEGFPDGAKGALKASFDILQMEAEEQWWNELAERAQSRLNSLQRSGDVKRLRKLVEGLINASDDLDDAPPNVQEVIHRVIRDAQQAIKVMS